MLSCLSPAKVNLFLRIIRRRPDGYHELASLFQTIDLCDTIHFEIAERDSLQCTDPSLPTDQTNLVNKAVALFRQNTGLNTYFDIRLDKKIPQQAGLGGGSSNAATTLWALNELTGRPASLQQLVDWGGALGSDVAFFLSEGSAYCTGRGEVIRSVGPLPPKKLIIVKPSQGLSTPQVYGQVKAEMLEQRDPEQALRNFMDGRPLYFNDLEEPAFKVMPELADLKRQLLNGGFETVLMSGSGSSFFCIGNGKVPSTMSLQCYSVSFINRTPSGWYS